MLCAGCVGCTQMAGWLDVAHAAYCRQIFGVHVQDRLGFEHGSDHWQVCNQLGLGCFALFLRRVIGGHGRICALLKLAERNAVLYEQFVSNIANLNRQRQLCSQSMQKRP